MTEDYYKFLREKEFFDSIINEVSDNQSWCSYIARIACSAYIEEIEDLDNTYSLIFKLIDNASVLYITSIVSYFFNLRKNSLSDKKVSKIIKLWSKLCEKLQSYKDDKAYNNCIIDLLQLISLMPYIDEVIMKNIEFSIRWIPQASIELYLLDSFLKLYADETSCKYVEKILESFSANKVFFYDYSGKLTELFKKIHNSNPTEAIKLCNIYVQGGYTNYLALLNDFKLKKKFTLSNE